MFDEIKEAIRKNLPSQVSEELQEYLSELEDAKDERNRLKKSCEGYLERINKLEKIDRDVAELIEGQKTLEKERQVFEINKREMEIQLLKEKYNDVKSLMSDVFRNKKLMYYKTKNGTVPVMRDGYVQQEQTSSSTVTEVTEE